MNTKSSLPSQITVAALVVVLAVLLIVWASLISMKRQMDIEAAGESQRHMAGRIEAFQEEVSLIASDYHNWTDLYLAAKQLDVDKLASNYGITAERGDVFQYAELFDGPFIEPLSWSANLGLEPQKGFLTPATRAALSRRVLTIDSTERQTIDYFGLRNGKLVMFSACNLLPEDDGLLALIEPDSKDIGIGVIGKVLSERRLSEIERQFFISDLEVMFVPPSEDAVYISLLGVAGAPVAWLQWIPPTPGSRLFWKMVPIMSVISLAFIFLSYFAAWLLRSKAKVLIEQEAISFKNARTDALTNLPNLFALREHLNRLFRYSNKECAILAIDLVRFKQINDTVGHSGGDAFLIEFSRRLKSLADDTTFVSRYGGDEFFIAISATGNLKSIIDEKCHRIIELSKQPIKCNGMMFDVLASKGVAIGRTGLMIQEELLRRADRAMYSAKARRSQKVILYDSEMKSQDNDYKAIEAELRRAVAEGGEFEMHYQPIVSSGKLSQTVKFEALARWTNPNLGRVSPDKFINVAETSGLIIPLGWMLLDLVCQDMKRLSCARVSINISPAQLMMPGFAKEFAGRVAARGISPSQVEVEVTEQVVILDDITIATELSMLRDHGFSLALDDFGTGYSSIGYLTRMQFDVLKIDRSFSPSTHKGKHGARMLQSMVGLAHAMGLEITAEGIETEEDADILCNIGVDYLQGYFIGRPEPIPPIPA